MSIIFWSLIVHLLAGIIAVGIIYLQDPKEAINQVKHSIIGLPSLIGVILFGVVSLIIVIYDLTKTIIKKII